MIKLYSRLLAVLAVSFGFVFLSLAPTAFAEFIFIDLSIKVIVHPDTGARPTGVTDAVLQTAVTDANTWMANYQRGYRFRIAEIVEIGGPPDGLNGPSKWYGEEARDSWAEFQSDTQNDARYLLRGNSLNFYITMGTVSNTGGACPIPSNPDDASASMACWGLVNDGPWWLVHEPGHFFGLPHTFAGEDKSTCTPGDDNISDTLPDSNCWTSRDQMANYHYGKPYAELNSAARRTLVNDTYYNVMSYHEAANKDTDEDRLTELQLDRWADTANSARASVVSGRTHFVSPSGSPSGTGTSTDPYLSISNAVAAANAAGGDIILLRPGVYDQTLTIDRPSTLRVARGGPALIGTSVAP